MELEEFHAVLESGRLGGSKAHKINHRDVNLGFEWRIAMKGNDWVPKCIVQKSSSPIIDIV